MELKNVPEDLRQDYSLVCEALRDPRGSEKELASQRTLGKLRQLIERIASLEHLRAENAGLREQTSDAICAFLDTPEAIDILKWMCFQLARMAHVFRDDGENIQQKAEEEQSFMLRKMLKHAAKHGTGWRTVAADELEAAHKRVVSARAARAREVEGS